MPYQCCSKNKESYDKDKKFSILIEITKYENVSIKTLSLAKEKKQRCGANCVFYTRILLVNE